MPTLSTLQMSLFGPGQLSFALNNPINIRRRKEFALLAYLAVEHDRIHSRESIMGLLWPEHSHVKANNNLRVALTRLRKAINRIEKPLIVSDRHTVYFDKKQLLQGGSAWLDVAEFDRLLSMADAHSHADPTQCPSCLADLTKASELYQGEFLSGFHLAECEAFDHWLLIQRERLHMEVMSLLPQLEEAHLANGNWKEAEKITRHHLSLDPLDEVAHYNLMQVLGFSGLRNAALSHYEFCCHLLDEELGVEPDEKIMLLADKIREGNLQTLYDNVRLKRINQHTEANGLNVRYLDAYAILNRLEPLPDQTLFGVHNALEAVGGAIRTREQSWLVSIEGIGGLGKTTLAHALVQQLLETSKKSDEVGQNDSINYMDIAWVSAKQEAYLTDHGMQTTGKPALDEESLMDQLLAQLADGPYPTNSSKEKRLALTQILKEKICLIVIDNLETVIDYQALLPLLRHLANPSKFLLTSRMSLVGQGDVFCYSLTELCATDALALLRHEAQSRGLPRLAQASEGQLSTIYETVGGNPLALKLVIGQLQFLPLEQILESLRQANTERVDQLYNYIYWQAWQMLDITTRHLLLSLPVVPNATFTQLGKASGLGMDPLQSALMSLRSLSLIETGGALDEPRYRLHRLTETFLMYEVVKWQEPTLHQSSEEAQYFVQRVLYMVEQWQEAEAVHNVDVTILDHEYESVVKAISLGLELSQGWTAVKPLIIAFTPFMERRGHWHTWHIILDRATDAARHAEDVDGEITLTALLARLCQRESRPEDVIYYYRRVIRLARRSGNRFEEARACSNLGYAYIAGGHWWRSEVLSCRALELFEALGSKHGRAHTHNHLGLLYVRRRLWEEAENHLKSACDLWEGMGDEFNLVHGYTNLSSLCMEIEQPQESLKWSEQALHYSELTGEAANISQPLMNIGIAYYQINDFEQAEIYLQRAESIYRTYANTIGLAMVWGNLGECSLAQGQWDKARSYFLELLNMCQEQDNWDDKIKVLMNLVQLELASDNQTDAKAYIARIEHISEQHTQLNHRKYIYEQLKEYSRCLN